VSVSVCVDVGVSVGVGRRGSHTTTPSGIESSPSPNPDLLLQSPPCQPTAAQPTGHLYEKVNQYAGRPGSSGLVIEFGDFSTKVGVADGPNELEISPDSPDVSDGIGAVEESGNTSFRGGSTVGLNPIHFEEGPIAVRS